MHAIVRRCEHHGRHGSAIGARNACTDRWRSILWRHPRREWRMRRVVISRRAREATVRRQLLDAGRPAPRSTDHDFSWKGSPGLPLRPWGLAGGIFPNCCRRLRRSFALPRSRIREGPEVASSCQARGVRAARPRRRAQPTAEGTFRRAGRRRGSRPRGPCTLCSRSSACG